MKTHLTNQNHLLKENVDRGNRVVPVYLYENNWHHYELYLHWHEEMEWIIMDVGSATFTVEGHSYTLDAGDCLFISPRQLHSGRSISDSCQFRAILIDPNFLSAQAGDPMQIQYIEPLINGQITLPPYLSKTYDHCQITTLMDNLTSLLKTKPNAYLLSLKALLLGLLAALEDSMGFEAKNTGCDELNDTVAELKQLLAFMKSHCHERLTLEQLAAKLSFNPQYFCRYFKQATGMTPIAYLTLLRIEKAALMLHSERAKVSEVCFECGFENVSYFIRTFKRHKGLTPKLYAARVRSLLAP